MTKSKRVFPRSHDELVRTVKHAQQLLDTALASGLGTDWARYDQANADMHAMITPGVMLLLLDGEKVPSG